jgi:hypothetical protein
MPLGTLPSPSVRLDATLRPPARYLGDDGQPTGELSDLIIEALRAYGVGVDSHSLTLIPDDDA